MKVVTLSNQDLDQSTFRLAREVMDSHPEPFDVVIAIRRGGAIVAQSFLKSFPAGMVRHYDEVELQRPSTKYKRHSLTKLLRWLPRPCLNLMRIVEARLLERRHKRKGIKVKKLILPTDTTKHIGGHGAKILVIDDAIDSGATAKAVADAIHNANPSAEVRLLTITVTTPTPLIDADYALYRNRTLVRFHWSDDYRK